MKKKIFRVTEDDVTDLELLVTMVRECYYLAGIRGKKSGRLPNEGSIIRALIRFAAKVAMEATARQQAQIRGEPTPKEPEPLSREKLMVLLFEEGHLGD